VTSENSCEIRLSNQASLDIQEIEEWYEKTLVLGLANQFLDQLERVILQVKQYPLSHPE